MKPSKILYTKRYTPILFPNQDFTRPSFQLVVDVNQYWNLHNRIHKGLESLHANEEANSNFIYERLCIDIGKYQQLINKIKKQSYRYYIRLVNKSSDLKQRSFFLEYLETNVMPKLKINSQSKLSPSHQIDDAYFYISQLFPIGKPSRKQAIEIIASFYYYDSLLKKSCKFIDNSSWDDLRVRIQSLCRNLGFPERDFVIAAYYATKDIPIEYIDEHKGLPKDNRLKYI